MPGLITLKCPSCGARLRFEKGTQVFTCDHCGNVHLLEANGQAMPARFNVSRHDWVRVGDYDIRVHEMLDECEEDARYIYINVEYRNSRAKNNLSCRASQWVLFDQEGYSYEYQSSNRALYENKNRPYLGGERFLNPGIQARGWVAFRVPPAAVLKRLHFLTGYLTTRTVDFMIGESAP